MVKLTDLIRESNLGLTLKKGKTITVTHNKSGKEIVIVDKPVVRKEYEKLGFYAESVDEMKKLFTIKNIKKALVIAKKMGGNMTGAVKKIEKLNRGLSDEPDVASALRKANESVNEAENKIADIRKILKTKKGKRIDSIFMDVETAEAVMKHYKSLSGSAKEKFSRQKIQNVVKSIGESVNEAKTQSIDGEELLDYLQKRFKMSRKQAIASMKKHNMDVSSIKKESVNEGTWPDTQTARLLSQAFDDAKVKVQKVWEKGNHEYIIRVRAKDGWTNIKMELNVISNVIMMDTQSGHVKLGELQPGSRGRKLTKNLKMLSKIPSFGVAGLKGLKYKIESVNESGIMYRAGVKKYGLEGMKKIQSAAGKGLGHAEIGKIKDQYDKKRKKRESISEGGTVEPAGNMAKIFKIVKDKQHAKIGGMLVDMFSASALVKIFDAVNDSNKEKLNKMNMNKLSYVLDKAFKSKVAV